MSLGRRWLLILKIAVASSTSSNTSRLFTIFNAECLRAGIETAGGETHGRDEEFRYLPGGLPF